MEAMALGKAHVALRRSCGLKEAKGSANAMQGELDHPQSTARNKLYAELRRTLPTVCLRAGNDRFADISPDLPARREVAAKVDAGP